MKIYFCKDCAKYQAALQLLTLHFSVAPKLLPIFAGHWTRKCHRGSFKFVMAEPHIFCIFPSQSASTCITSSFPLSLESQPPLTFAFSTAV